MIQIMEAYPEFRAYYEDAYRLCMDVGRYIGMYSRELRELDHNTVQLMIDLMQEDLEKQKATINAITKEMQEQLLQRDDLIKEKDECLLQQSEQLSQQSEQLS